MKLGDITDTGRWQQQSPGLGNLGLSRVYSNINSNSIVFVISIRLGGSTGYYLSISYAVTMKDLGLYKLVSYMYQ